MMLPNWAFNSIGATVEEMRLIQLIKEDFRGKDQG
jgi:hypothetical protein